MKLTKRMAAVPWLLLVATILQPARGEACSAEPYAGSVCMTFAAYCPDCYLPADGRILDKDRYLLLYAVIGDQYGGDGRKTFALPDLRQGFPVI
ncbi:MAG: tail fiber protein [Magnetococcales bacterium]|nr:tail fiber protein [Magnetococcales bacterium]MBF0117063.1 tail fiber protein [Magnetococcales bacterium]